MNRRLENALELDLESKATELSRALQEAVLHRLRKRGLVVAVSGGVDSACVAALGVRALGPERVFALLLPERDSSPESLAYGKALCEKLRISHQVKDIAPILDAAGCYQARNAAVREVVPEFQPDMPWKIVLVSDPLSSQSATTGSRRRRICKSSQRRTSSNGPGRCSSTTTPTGSTTPLRELPIGSSTTRVSS